MLVRMAEVQAGRPLQQLSGRYCVFLIASIVFYAGTTKYYY